MARPREFDVEAVLREAMIVFWEKGFEGTSFADIEARTGVKKASLYAAYGDKHSLFLKAMQAYQEQGRADAKGVLAGEDPKQAIRDWYHVAIGGSAKGECAQRGCLQVNTIVELAARDSEVAALAREHAEQMVAMVAATIARGQARGQFRADEQPEALAAFLLTSLHGLSIAGKAGAAGRDVDRIAAITLSALEP